MKYRALFFPLILLTIVLLLVACGATDPSPTLPPPPTLDSSGDQPPAIVVEGGTAVPETEARETAVADSSPTPVETPTLAPTATLDNQDEGLVEVVDAGPLPAISQSLLFIGDGALKRWGTDGQVLTLVPGGNESASEEPRSTYQPVVGDVVNYSLRADGRRAAVVRLIASTEISNTVTAVTETIQTYELSYLNLEDGSNRVLVPAISGRAEPPFQLSRDGKHVAFSGERVGFADSITLGEEITGALYVVETETGLLPEKLSDCNGICQNPVWHLDNNIFVFGDRSGLHLYNLSSPAPELLVSGDNGSPFPAYFGPISWAKNGRWLLMWYSTGIEGREQAIFDIPTKQVMVIPHTFQYADPLYAELTWMADDRLFMVRPDDAQTQSLGETYRIDHDAGVVALDEAVVLSADLNHPTAPMHWENGRFGYGLLAEDWNENVGLYQRVAFNEPAEQVNTLLGAIYAPEIEWATDASGAVMSQNGVMYYAPVGGQLYRLDAPTVGRWVHQFSWLP